MVFGEDIPKIIQPNFVAKCTLVSDPGKSVRSLILENKDEVGFSPGQLIESINNWIVKFSEAVFKKAKDLQAECEEVSCTLTFNESKSVYVLTAVSHGEEPLTDKALVVVFKGWLEMLSKQGG